MLRTAAAVTAGFVLASLTWAGLGIWAVNDIAAQEAASA